VWKTADKPGNWEARMELGSIPDVRAFTNARELPADFQLTAVMEINGAAGSGKQGRPGQQKKAPAQPAADTDELTLSGESELASSQAADDQAAGPGADQDTNQSVEAPEHSINLFA
jgi:hypothetical protein